MPTSFNIHHADDEYIHTKIKGRGGSVKFYKKDGQHWSMSRAVIGYIGGVPRYKIMWYNLCLLIRWVRRCIL
jgi:hypothetical protein